MAVAKKKKKKKVVKKKAATKKTGRPSKCTPRVLAEILRRITENETLTKICKDAHIPATSTIWRETERNKAFRIDYTRAQEFRAGLEFEEARDIVDNVVGTGVVTSKEGDVLACGVLTSADVRLAEIRSKVRMQRAGICNARYSEKAQVDHKFPEGIKVEIEYKTASS